MNELTDIYKRRNLSFTHFVNSKNFSKPDYFKLNNAPQNKTNNQNGSS